LNLLKVKNGIGIVLAEDGLGEEGRSGSNNMRNLFVSPKQAIIGMSSMTQKQRAKQ